MSGSPGQYSLQTVAFCSVLLVGVSIAAFVGMFSPIASIVLMIFIASLALVNVDLHTAILLVAGLLVFDLQRQVGGVWLYVDFAVLPLAMMFRRNPPPRRSWIFFPYIAWALMSGFWRAVEPHVFFTTIVRWGEMGILCCAVAASCVAEDVFVVLGYTLIPLSLYAVYQISIGDFGELYHLLVPRFEGETNWLPGRASSLFYDDNAFGGFSAVLLVALLTLAMNQVKTKTCLLLSAFAALGLLCSGSRGGAVGVLVGFLVSLSCKKKLRWAIALVMVFLAALWVASYFVELPVERMSQSDDLTVETRLLAFYAGTQAFLAHPVIGIGSTNFVNALYEYTNWPFADIRSPHNTYLHLLCENGVIGAALFFTPVLYCLRRAWKNRERPVMLACCAAICCSCVHGVVDFLWLAPQYGLTMAIIVGLTLQFPVPAGGGKLG